MHEVNLLAVLVAGIVPMIVGFLWYGQLFGKRWLELMETTAEEIQKNFNPWKTHGASFGGIGDVVELLEKLCRGSESRWIVGGKPVSLRTRPAGAGRLHRVSSQFLLVGWWQDRPASVMSYLNCRLYRRRLLPDERGESHAENPIQGDVGGAREANAERDHNPWSA